MSILCKSSASNIFLRRFFFSVYITKQMLLAIAVRALSTTRERVNWRTTSSAALTSRRARRTGSTSSACSRRLARRLCRQGSFHRRWRLLTHGRRRRQLAWASPAIITYQLKTFQVRRMDCRVRDRVPQVRWPSTAFHQVTSTVIQETLHYLIGKFNVQ